MRRTETWLNLSFLEKRFLLKSLLILWFVRLSLWMVRYSVVRRVLDHYSFKHPNGPSCQALSAEQIARLVQIASRLVPRASCLVQSLSLNWLLKRQSFNSELCVGVRKNKSGKLEAHAWVEAAGKILLNPHVIDGFQPLTRPGDKEP